MPNLNPKSKTCKTVVLALLGLSIYLTPDRVWAQFESVETDLSAGWFNNGQDLPADRKLVFNGVLDPAVAVVEMRVWRGGADHSRAPFYQADWRKIPGETASRFRILFNYTLNGNSEYDFRFDMYRHLSGEEQRDLEQRLAAQIETYLATVVAARKGSKRSWVSGLNEAVLFLLRPYRTEVGAPFEHFSPALSELLGVYQGLEKDTSDNPAAVFARIERMAKLEITAALTPPLLFLSRSTEIRRYSTTATKSPLVLSVGYAGVYLSGNFDNIAYATGPFAGVSFPLSARAQAPGLLRRTSVSVGVFANNFENQFGEVISGPVLGRPYTLGLGFQPFRFVRLQTGFAALETRKEPLLGSPVSEFSLRPYVGISLELGLWLGFNTIR